MTDTNEPTVAPVLPNPYDSDAQGALHNAWNDGHFMGEANRLVQEDRHPSNPWTQADSPTQFSAWSMGFIEGKYIAHPFDPMNLWDSVEPSSDHLSQWDKDRAFTMYLHVSNKDDEKTQRLVWDWSLGSYKDEFKPKWANNRVEDRCIELAEYDAKRMVTNGMYSRLIPDGSIDLPCPPYTFEYVDGGMTITAGKFSKHGSKEEWEGVLGEMQEKFDEMPTGLNIEDAYIEVSVVVVATQTHNVSIPISALVETDNGSVFTGSMDELESDVDAALDSWGDQEIEQYMDTDDVEWAYADTEISEWNADDTGYDIRNGVSEL